MNSSGRIETIENLGATIFVVRVRPTAPLHFQAGQYVKIQDGYYSIASPPESAVLEFVVRAPGKGVASDRLVALAVGSPVSIEGPLGNLVYIPAADRHVCFICQGTGVSPLFSIARSAAFRASPPLSALFLVGCRDEQEMILAEKFGLALPSDRYKITLSRPTQTTWLGLRGRVTEHLKHDVLGIDWARTEFYICGSFEMIAETKAVLKGLGVRAEAIHAEA